MVTLADPINFADFSTLDLPDGVMERVEMFPMEDILLSIFRRGLPSLTVHSLIPPSEYISYPFAVARRGSPVGNWRGDARFLDRGRATVSVFTQDPDGENKGIMIGEAIRVMMRQAWLEHWNFPGLGSIVDIKMVQEPTRVPDWATSAGPVQFADLPGNVWRAEIYFNMVVRRPL